MNKILLTALFIPASIFMFSCSGGGGDGNDNTNQNMNQNINQNVNQNANQNMNQNINQNMNQNINQNTNGNQNGGSGGGGGTVSTTTYLFYSGSLFYLDPENPSNPVQLTAEDVSDYFLPMTVTSYDSATNRFSGLHKKYLVYLSNRTIYKVNAEKGSTAPSPVQVSSINDVCEFYDSFDEFLSPDNSYVYVLRTGTDNTCDTADDTYSLVRVGMSSSDTPIDLGNKVIVGPYATQEMEIIEGWLVLENNTLKKCNEDLTSCTDLLSGVVDAESLDRYDFDNPKYLIIVDKGGSKSIYSFNPSNSTFEEVLPNYTGEDELMDTNAMYFVEQTFNPPTSTFKIKKLSFNNWNVSEIYSSSSITNITSLESTQNYIIFEEWENSGTANVKAINKDNNSVTTIDSAPTNLSLRNYFTTSDTLFYNKITSGGNNYCYWEEGSSNATCTQGYIAGVAISPNGDARITRGIYSHILVVEGCSTNSGICIGGTLKALSTSDLQKKTIGSLPSDTYGIYTLGIGKYMLGTAVFPKNSSEVQQDIYFIDIQAPTLQRITNTPDKDEYSVF